MKDDCFRSTKHKLKGLRNSVALCFENISESALDGANSSEILNIITKYRSMVDNQFLKTIQEFEHNYLDLASKSTTRNFEIYSPKNIPLHGIKKITFIGPQIPLQKYFDEVEIDEISFKDISSLQVSPGTFYFFTDLSNIDNSIDFIASHCLQQKSAFILKNDIDENLEKTIITHEVFALTEQEFAEIEFGQSLTTNPIVLLDDDEIVRASWSLKAKRLALARFKSFEKANDLMDQEFSSNTLFFPRL